MEKLSIANEMARFDLKDREFYNSLTDEERRKFSNYLMIRWGSCVNGGKEFQEYYLVATNERLNKYFYDISKHPKLQWLCATTVSPGMGVQQHNWISPKKKDSNSGIRKQLAALFPHIEDDALDVMAKVNTKKDITDYLKKLGQEK